MRKVAEYEALTGTNALTAAEVKLIAAMRAGGPCVLQDDIETVPEADDNPAHTIRADLLALLITGGTAECGLSPFGVDLTGAYIKGELRLTHLSAKGDTSLFCCYFDNLINIRQAHFQVLALDESHLPGINAQGVVLEADLFLRDVIATGSINLAGARIGGQLSCKEATLNGMGGDALNGQGAEVTADLILHGVTALGRIQLIGAKVGGQLDLQDAKLSGSSQKGKHGTALTMQRARVDGSFFWKNVTVLSGSVSVASAHVGDLVDNSKKWPADIVLNGFTYDRLQTVGIRAKDRIPWLEKGSGVDDNFTPQPYTQLAKVLREMGHFGQAREVLFERQKRLAAEQYWRGYRKNKNKYLFPLEKPLKDVQFLARWGFDLLLRWVVGYGYKPLNAVVCLVILFLTATALAHAVWEEGSFAPNSDVILVSDGWQKALEADCLPPAQGCDPNPAATWSNDPQRGLDWDSFNRYGYAADLVIPVLDLGQTDAWAPSKDRGPWGLMLWWGRWVLIAVGWIVTALGVAALTGIMQRNKED